MTFQEKPVSQPSRTADIRRLAKTDEPAAIALLGELLSDQFGFAPRNLAINHDQYSLNSLNGFFDTDDGAFFFKFHQEDGEEAMSGEYYRADILARAGLPVDQPLHMSTLPGEQTLIYRRRSDPRFSDVLRGLDLSDDAMGIAEAVEAERALNRELLRVSRDTLHVVTAEQVQSEPIHRLFYERMIDPVTRQPPGGRYRDFYIDQNFRFPGLTLDWKTFSTARVTINDMRYGQSFGELFDAALERLRPEALADAGGVTAHGDAHNANVWYGDVNGRKTLSFFDPAFAGEHIPTLLAEVKSTFHNIFAHPLWLYDPREAAQRFSAEAVYDNGELTITTDWRLSAVRKALLGAKGEELWRPLLTDLAARDILPADWRRVLRLGLFLCPTLVMNLRAGATSHNEVSSLIAFSVAMQVGSEPETGDDVVSAFLDAIDPHHG